MQTYVHNKTFIQIFITVFFMIANKWEQPKYPLRDKWINKIQYIHTMKCCVVCSLSHIWLFMTPWTLAGQIPLPIELPSKNTGVGCHFLLHRTFPAQGSSTSPSCLLHWQAASLPLELPGKPPVQCHSAIKKNEVLIHATTWMNLENIIQSERSQSGKTTYYNTLYVKWPE